MDKEETNQTQTPGKVATIAWLVFALTMAAIDLGFLDTSINGLIAWASASTGVLAKLIPVFRAFAG